MDGFFFNDTATPEIYTLSLHDALPICLQWMSAGTASSWDAKIIIGERSEHSPSLAFFNGTFYIAWTGTDDQHHVNVMSSADGVNWGGKRSEERRVGEEGRSRGAPYHLTKKDLRQLTSRGRAA